ncbi:hypothetical protein [Dactylosporangium sp. CA-139066]|uniref:hypothetical protein n=1 Tax=Dactylosporangium sp. CA-139066 TaxID=3239930 RepID=UPI003D8AD6D1
MDLNEYNAGDLLRTLPDEPPRPPSIDVARAMRDGRRRRRLRRRALAGGVLVLTLAAVAAVPVALAATRGPDRRPDLAPAASGSSGGTSAAAKAAPTVRATARAIAVPTSCKAEKLPIPDNVTMALVTAADPTGSIIFGRSYPKGGDQQVLVWQDGRATKVAVPGADQAISAVNAAGVGVGNSWVDSGPVAWLYRDGKVTKLPGGDGVTVAGINAAEVIVGNNGTGRPLIWSSPTAEPRPLALPDDATGGIASAIDEDGTVIGSIYTTIPGGVQTTASDPRGVRAGVAYAWAPDGTGRRLPAPAVVSGTGYGAFTIRNGWVIGVNRPAGAPASGLRWDLATGTVETVPGFATRPDTANASGWMVGTDPEGHGLMVAGDKRMQLPDPFQHKPSTTSLLAVTISDDGRTIAGQADDPSDTIRAIVWRCH